MIELADTRVHVEVTGPDDAPTVLLIHSLATDLGVWDDLVAAGSGRRWVRYDLRGHGRSAATDPPYDLDRLVADAVAVLDSVGAARASVVGLSIGGMIAMGLAIDHPDRVDRLVVADARADAPPAYVELWERAIAATEAGRFDQVVAESLERWFTPGGRRSRATAVDRTATVARATPAAGFVGCARALQGVDYLGRLDRIGAPTRFVTGELDPAAPPGTMAAMAARVPGSVLEVIAGAAHLTPLEAPTEFNRVVLAFLDQPLGDPPAPDEAGVRP